MTIPNVLAARYASAAMQQVWSPEQKVIAERRLWLAVLAAQRDLGVDFGGADPDEVIVAYEGVLDQVDLASMAERERVTRHDVKARIEEFNDLAGFEHVHKGMTSRDLTENVEQLQIVSSLRILRDRVVATLVHLAGLEDFGAFPAVVEAELARYLPFLTTTKVLMAAVRRGVGRETAHEAIREHAVAVALEMRESGRSDNDLFDRLAGDQRLRLSRSDLDALVGSPLELAGTAPAQVAAVVSAVAQVAARHPEAAAYRPGRVL